MSDAPTKKALVEEIIRKLEADLAVLVEAAHVAHAAATHEESKAEDKYDTRGLEASYLAGAQAKRAAEIQEMIREYRHMDLKPVPPDAKVAATALVEMRIESRSSWAFVAFRGGGFRVQVGQTDVQIVSVHSPLGGELIGRSAGEEFEFRLPNGQVRDVEIAQVV